MSGSKTNTVGDRIRFLRKERGITGQQLGRLLKCGQSRVSKIEAGNLKPSLTYIEGVIRALKLPTNEAEHLRTLTESFLIEFDRWRLSSQKRLPELQRRVAKIEGQTAFLRSFQWVVIPGLLQTRRYMFNIFRLLGEASAIDVEAAVRERLRRQSILGKRNKRFTFIVAEQALCNRFGTTDVMVDQIVHLHRVQVNSRSRVEIKVLPHGAVLPALPVNSFDLFDERLVEIETQTTTVRLWEAQDIHRYLGLFRSLEDSTVSGQDAVTLLEGIRQKLLETRN